jgi:uncharacterized membrane protein
LKTRLVEPTRLRELARSAFWLVPSLCVMSAVGLAIGVLWLDHHLGSTRTTFLFPGPPAAARSLLSSIIQAMITFTGLVFSITIVVLQLTSAQFSPRVLRTFLRDRTIRLAFGVFLATFVYAMVVLRDVRGAGVESAGVPRLAITVSFVLVLVSIAMFIRYVAHIVNLIRAATIIDSIAGDARVHLEQRFPATAGPEPRLTLAPPRASVSAPGPGVLVAVNEAALIERARVADSLIRVVPRVGDYVPTGGRLLDIHGEQNLDGHVLVGALSFDTERTLRQDLPFAFRELVDIAQRSLSPAVNDPTTAVQAIDALYDLLRRLSARRLSRGVRCDSEGKVRLIVPQLSFEGYLGLAIGQIWHYAAGAVQAPQRLAEMLNDLRAVAIPEHLAPIERWIDVVLPVGERDPTWSSNATVDA